MGCFRMLELIVYACPTGELAGQLEAYYTRARTAFGANAAHRYSPHITLTGFFHDTVASIPIYVNALAEALAVAPQPPMVAITGLMFEPHFHGLLIESPWLKNLTQAFAWLAQSPTRADAIRLKDWLHLSLAYKFQPEHAAPLKAVAREMVDISAPVVWELRFYERFGQDEWRRHAAWSLVKAGLTHRRYHVASMAMDMTITATASTIIPVSGIREAQLVDLDRVFPLIKLLSEPNRLRIFALLTQGECCVCDIETAAAMPQNLVSHHLRVLREAELIEVRRDGRWAYYRVNKAHLARVYSSLCSLFNPEVMNNECARC